MKLLLAVFCCVALATTAFSAPSSIQSDQAGSDVVKAKTADYQRPDIKHLCLKESKQYNCRYVGCPTVKPCDTEGCTFCETHAVGQSDVVCCNDKSGYGSHEDDSSPEDLFATPLKVGTCDWDYDLFNCWEVGCDPTIEMENGALKIGTAWATCYINSDAEHCGHPLCDRMVMSFQGGAYLTFAYSKTPGGLAASGVSTDASGVKGSESGAELGCFGFEEEAAENRARSGRSKMSGMVKHIRSSGLMKKLHKQSKRSGQASHATIESTDYYHHKSSSNQTWYYGVALTITGPVTITSMHKKMDYDRGMLEYNPFFFDYGPVEAGTKPAAKGTIVVPHQYNILLVSDKSSGDDYYKKDDYDSYKPDYKPEYREEYKPEYKPEYKEERPYGREGEPRYYRDGPDREGPHYRR